MKLSHRFLLIIVLFISATVFVFPWASVGISMPDILSRPYTLGLDLQGGVELDYKVDMTTVRAQSGSKWSESDIIEGLKTIIDKRVSSLGLSEPTLQTAKYGDETHIIVQIPTQDYGNISDIEKQQKSNAAIIKAKEVIGKVVQLEFREQKLQVTEQDKKERLTIAQAALSESRTTPFATVGRKYQDQYELVAYT
jgi:preprotein translocase subunit SecD